MKSIAIIPARYASTRLPGKPLIDIGGKSLIERVYERVVSAEIFSKVLIATDNERIAAEAKRIGANVVMTAVDHPSGTDRCWEAFEKNNEAYDLMVNVQGDEPFVDISMLKDLVKLFETKQEVEIATVVKPMRQSDLSNPNKVKAMLKHSGEVYAFSRSKDPFPEVENLEWNYYKHIGVYAFRSGLSDKLPSMRPTANEKLHRLEQLRWMDNGLKIFAVKTDTENPAVDTPADVQYLKKWMQENNLR